MFQNKLSLLQIKQMEIQLEEADEERSSLSRQKRELEEQLKSMRDLELDRRDPDTEKRLRRDLKRYKALLSDAQTMVDHLKADAVSKQQMKQLKAEVRMAHPLRHSKFTVIFGPGGRAAIHQRGRDQVEESDRTRSRRFASSARRSYERKTRRQYLSARPWNHSFSVSQRLFLIRVTVNDVTFFAQAESRVSALLRETHELQSKLDDEAEDAQETLRKYRSLVNQQSDDRRQLIELQTIIEEMKHEKNSLEDKVGQICVSISCTSF